jgi:hypothetical protein
MAGNRARLAKIIDLLGPGMWLELDHNIFPMFFGYQLDGSEKDREPGIGEARAFASALGAAFLPDRTKNTVRMGRAYFRDANSSACQTPP